MPFLTKQKQTTEAPSSGKKKRPAAIRGRAPTKTNINMALVGIKKTRWGAFALALVLILLGAAAIGKFLVYDRLQQVYHAQAEAEQVRRDVDACYARIEAYGELNDIYAHYTYTGMNAEELGRVDRVAVMELLQEVVFNDSFIANWNLDGNRLALSIEGETLQDINLIAQRLMESDIVSYCEVNTAETEGSSRNEDEQPDRVRANIVVFLVKPEEEVEEP